MKYISWLKKSNKMGVCPFCNLKKEEIIQSYKNFNVILTRAPYTKGHILIVPKFHYVIIGDMPKRVRKQMYNIVDERCQKLHKKYKNISLLIRNGYIDSSIGKSMDHAHFHIIPEIPIGSETGCSNNAISREFFDYKKYIQLTSKFKDEFL